MKRKEEKAKKKKKHNALAIAMAREIISKIFSVMNGDDHF